MQLSRMTKIFLLATAVLLSGCASLHPPSDALQGQWYFSHIRKGPFFFGQFPPPPRFDGLAFAPPNKIHLHCSMPPMDFDGIYRIADRQLIYEFHPPDVDKPIQHDVMWAIEDRGQTLILSSTKWIWCTTVPHDFCLTPSLETGHWKSKAVRGRCAWERRDAIASIRAVSSGTIGYGRPDPVTS